MAQQNEGRSILETVGSIAVIVAVVVVSVMQFIS